MRVQKGVQQGQQDGLSGKGACPAKPKGSLISIPCTHDVGEDNRVLKVVLLPPHMLSETSETPHRNEK